MEIAGLSGIVDSQYLSNYYKGSWNVGVLGFVSSTESSQSPTENYLTNRWDGMWYDDGSKIELEKLGSSVQLSTGTEDIWNLPYPARMRPIRDWTYLRTAEQVVIVSIQFFAFDTKYNGSAEQDADVNTAILDSLSANPNDAFVQTRFFANMPVNWLVNFFRPKFKVNGRNILHYYENTALTSGINLGTGYNRADLSIGEFLPLDLQPYEHITEAVQSIEVDAFCGQLIKENGNVHLKRYPLLCRAFVTYKK